MRSLPQDTSWSTHRRRSPMRGRKAAEERNRIRSRAAPAEPESTHARGGPGWVACPIPQPVTPDKHHASRATRDARSGVHAACGEGTWIPALGDASAGMTANSSTPTSRSALVRSRAFPRSSCPGLARASTPSFFSLSKRRQLGCQIFEPDPDSATRPRFRNPSPRTSITLRVRGVMRDLGSMLRVAKAHGFRLSALPRPE
jgi:hypothetical protein